MIKGLRLKGLLLLVLLPLMMMCLGHGDCCFGFGEDVCIGVVSHEFVLVRSF